MLSYPAEVLNDTETCSVFISYSELGNIVIVIHLNILLDHLTIMAFVLQMQMLQETIRTSLNG